MSTHPDMMAAFAANDVFQKTLASGGHIRTKIVTLKDQVAAGQTVRPSQLAESDVARRSNSSLSGWAAIGYSRHP